MNKTALVYSQPSKPAHHGSKEQTPTSCWRWHFRFTTNIKERCALDSGVWTLGRNGKGVFLINHNKPGSQVLSADLSPYLIHGMAGLPHPPAQGYCCPSPSCHSLCNPIILVTWSFLLSLIILIAFALASALLPVSTWLRLMFTLYFPRCSWLWFYSLFM